MNKLIQFTDITMVICIRSHINNQWVLDRLMMIGDYYDPMPSIIVLDFGSEGEFKNRIVETCRKYNFNYYYEEDFGTYSPACAHNRAFERVKTQLVFFCDIDVFGRRDLFHCLANAATAMDMSSRIDSLLILPVYHLDDQRTDMFCDNYRNKLDSAIDRIFYDMSMQEFNIGSGAFIAPYSNIILMNTDFFRIVGGYDENFRGHGSEDFEFLIRCLLHQNFFPTPKNMAKDYYGPLQEGFFSPGRGYEGFRAYLEIASFPAESFGLRVIHLFHVKNGPWKEKNDWKRERFNAALDKYKDSHHNLLIIDFVRHSKSAICLCKHMDQWGYFLPLRLIDFQILPFFDDEDETLSRIVDLIVSGNVTLVAIFNPYMKSHAKFLPIIWLAREKGIEIMVIERGALPGSLYYSDDVAYISKNYQSDSFKKEQFSEQELDAAHDYMKDLRTGKNTLEKMDSYSETSERYKAVSLTKSKKIFIPLQLDDDMAVTIFTNGYMSYSEFLKQIHESMDRYDDILFIIKPHPLSKSLPFRNRKNVFIAERTDNVHAIIDVSSHVVCYNSGVALLAVSHEKPVFTIGNAYFNINNCGYRCHDVFDALNKIYYNNFYSYDRDNAIVVFAWLLRKYSFFNAVDVVKEFHDRFSHGYKNIQVIKFSWNNHRLNMERVNGNLRFSWTSYMGRRVYRDTENKIVQKKSHNVHSKLYIKYGILFNLYCYVYSLFLSEIKVDRLRRDPVSFLAGAKFWFSRLGKFLFLCHKGQ